MLRNSWAPFRADSFGLTSPARVCDNQPRPCIAYRVQSGNTLEQIAALHGTTTWRIRQDNRLLQSGVDKVVLPRLNDVLAVRPSPGREALRWQWTQWTNKTGMETCSVPSFLHRVPLCRRYLWAAPAHSSA
jgi:hypothetical protein